DALRSGNFAVQDAPARGHELRVAGHEASLAPRVVLVEEFAGQHEGHRLDAPGGWVGKPAGGANQSSTSARNGLCSATGSGGTTIRARCSGPFASGAPARSTALSASCMSLAPFPTMAAGPIIDAPAQKNTPLSALGSGCPRSQESAGAPRTSFPPTARFRAR